MENTINDLKKVASQSKKINPVMSKDLEQLAKHLASTLTDEQLDVAIVDIDKKNSQKKEAKLIEKDDIVVCVDNFGPLFKGRRYVVSNANIPGFLCVSEETGGEVGIFAVNRFVLDNNEQ